MTHARTLTIAISLLAGTAFGCADRAHLYHKTGLPTKSAFARQVQAKGPRPGGLTGVDSEIQMANYRALTTLKGPSAEPGSPVLMPPPVRPESR